LDFCKRKQDLKAKNVPKPERIKKRREDHRLLEEAIADLNNALNINTTMNLNQIKCIFILILIAKCNFYNEKYTEASNDLKKALLKFSDLNKYFFEKNLWEQIDPRVMFIINGLIIEQILFNLGRVCEKLKKKQLSGWIFNKMMEISYFRTNEIYRKACGKLYKYFEVEKENLQFSNCKSLLSKITRRLKRYGSNKKICILVSENLLKYFNSSYELREVLLRCVDKYISEFDLVSFMQFDLSIQCYVAEAAKVYNSKIFRETENFCKYSGNIDEDQRIKTNFYRAMNSAISILINGETNTLESTEDSNDKYIFSFLFAEDFRFGSNDENKAILNGLIKNKISLYNFFFDDQIQESKLLKIKKYLKDVVEGFVIRVKNFKIIKQAFQNISNKGIQKNILNSTFENHKYIL